MSGENDALEVARTDAVARALTAEKALAAEAKKSAALQARLDTAQKSLRANSESRFDFNARVSKRVDLLERARPVLPLDYSHAGKTDREIMLDAIGHAGVEFEGAPHIAWVAGRFAGILDAAAREDGAIPVTRVRGAIPVTRVRGDAGEPYRIPSRASKLRP